ncbi:hypothetical protein ACWDSF_03290 [Nocardia beijingensis]
MTTVTEASNKTVLPIIVWDQAYNRTPTRTADGKLLPRTVMNAIRTYMNNTTLTGWVKQETLAEATGLDLRTVKRHIAANVQAGWLKVTERGNSAGRANAYELTFPRKGTQMSPSLAQVTQMSPEGGHVRPLNGDADVTPTTDRTTPESSSLTTVKSGDTNVPLSGDGSKESPETASDVSASSTVTADDGTEQGPATGVSEPVTAEGSAATGTVGPVAVQWDPFAESGSQTPANNWFDSPEFRASQEERRRKTEKEWGEYTQSWSTE